MTGGTSSSSSRDARRWEEKELDGMLSPIFYFFLLKAVIVLRKARDQLIQDLSEISKSRRKLASDEQLRSDISTCETKLNSSKDSHVQFMSFSSSLSHLSFLEYA
jgi:hypothetical protein